MSIKIKDLPLSERPREKLTLYGVGYLSTPELLAVILNSGTRGLDVISLTTNLLYESGGLDKLLRLSKSELKNIKGIGEVKANQIIVLAEIIKRTNNCKIDNLITISSPKDCVNLLNNDMYLLNKEVLKIIMLNVKNKIIGLRDISMGSLNSSIVHPREVFNEAIRNSAASIIVAHNHPSGDPSPSKEDVLVTKRLKECGDILGIAVLDHIIIGNGSYVSLKEKGLM